MYLTPMRPGHYRVYSKAEESFWCCVGSGIENHAKYGEMIYANDGTNLYVNLFIPSVLDWKEKGIKVNQSTRRGALTPPEKIPSLKISDPNWAELIKPVGNNDVVFDK